MTEKSKSPYIDRPKGRVLEASIYRRTGDLAEGMVGKIGFRVCGDLVQFESPLYDWSKHPVPLGTPVAVGTTTLWVERTEGGNHCVFEAVA